MRRLRRRDIFIGVDGGATKTVVRVEDARGRLLGEARSGAASIRLSVTGSWQSILDGVEAALAQAGLRLDDAHCRFFCGAGLAGTEIPSARERFVNTPHPFARLVLKSDAHAACLGAHGGADGAVIAIGTGVVAYRIHRGQERQISGWGFPHGDEGSGAWLGLEALRLTLHWLDGRHPASPLLDSVFQHFHRDQTQLVTWANQTSASQFAQLAPLVVEHVELGTPLAVALIRRAATEIERIGSALAQLDQGQPLPCSLLGGMAPFIEPWLSAELHSRLRPRLGDAVAGALLMIRRAASITETREHNP